MKGYELFMFLRKKFLIISLIIILAATLITLCIMLLMQGDSTDFDGTLVRQLAGEPDVNHLYAALSAEWRL